LNVTNKNGRYFIREFIDKFKQNKVLSDVRSDFVELLERPRLLLNINPNTPDTVITQRVIDSQLDRLPAGWYGFTEAVIRLIDGAAKNEIFIDKQGELRASWKRTLKAVSPLTIILDGTSERELWQALLNQDITEYGCDISEQNLTITQFPQKSFAKSQWLDSNQDRIRPGALGRLLWHIEQTKADAFIGQKMLEDKLNLTLKTRHFGALRGFNDIENCQGLVVCGRSEPTAFDVENITRALFSNENLTLPGFYERQRWLANNQYIDINGHVDKRCALILRQIRDSEVKQALARARPYSDKNQARACHVLTNTPISNYQVSYSEVLIPEPVFRVLGLTGQGCVIETSRPSLMSFDLNTEMIKEIKNWGKVGLPLLSNILISERPTLFLEFRLKGDRGSSRQCVSFVDIETAISVLESKYERKLTSHCLISNSTPLISEPLISEPLIIDSPPLISEPLPVFSEPVNSEPFDDNKARVAHAFAAINNFELTARERFAIVEKTVNETTNYDFDVETQTQWKWIMKSYDYYHNNKTIYSVRLVS
jgi:hypothetical protein